MKYMKFDDGCGRYSLNANLGQLIKRYNLADQKIKFTYNLDIKPSNQVPVVLKDEKGNSKLELMRWGLVPFWAKEIKMGYTTFNARIESIFSKPMWRSVYKKRVLVPATGYFEWKEDEGSSKKSKYYFHIKDLDIFSFAGFYDTWENNLGKINSFTIITKASTKEASKIHDRMPIILNKNNENLWINPKFDQKIDLDALLHESFKSNLNIYKVDNDPKLKFDDLKIIQPYEY